MDKRQRSHHSSTIKYSDVYDYTISPDRRLFSATHEEVLRGDTADVYFLKAREILEGAGLLDTPVTAEVFAGRTGILAGTEEVKGLLKERGLEVWGVSEGTPVDRKEVVLRIKGPYGAFAHLETALLGILASSSGWATASRQCRQAAGERGFLVFGARHIHPAVAPVMERAAVIGGANGASCVLGAALAGKAPQGTVPHALILVFGDTLEAAKAYDRFMPEAEPRIVLVDTFQDEVVESLRLAAEMKGSLEAVRLDTPSERGGVTPALVNEVRTRLDMAGHNDVKVFVSGGLNPERIAALQGAGAEAFGVGSYISGASPIGMTMDLKEIEGKPMAKRGRIPGVTRTEGLERLL